MSEAPNEIWCNTGLYWDYKTDWSEGEWQNNDEDGGVKYTRTDLVRAQIEAAVKRALEGAANEVDCGGCRGQCLDPANCHAKEADYIRALDSAQFLS